MNPLPPEDIDFVLDEAASAFEQLRGKRVFITGGTGFFGCWLLETMLAANARHGLEIKLMVLSRAPEVFAERMPSLASHPEVVWIKGGILELSPALVARQLGVEWRGDAVIHLVTEANVAATAAAPLDAMEVIVEGTRRALDFAVAAGAKRFLFTSSGAVYGRQPADVATMPETSSTAPETTDLTSVYGAAGNAKRYAELLCAAYAKQRGIEAVIARCFSFLGPYLPLGSKFAAGNFLDDALHGRDLVIKGDGSPIRSYLYAADLTAWLLALLTRGAAGRAYNVGSEEPVSIRQLADKVAAASGNSLKVNVLGEPNPQKTPDRYVPSTRQAREELGLTQKISIELALERTLRWLREEVTPK